MINNIEIFGLKEADNKYELIMNVFCAKSIATYVGVHSAPQQCLEILKTNHSARNFLEHA